MNQPIDIGLSDTAICDVCGERADRIGALYHDPDCLAARARLTHEAQARGAQDQAPQNVQDSQDDARDITTDGAATFIAQMHLHHAREFASQTLGHDPEDDAPTELERRADLTAGYLAGYQAAEQSALSLLREQAAQNLSAIHAWAGVAADSDDLAAWRAAQLRAHGKSIDGFAPPACGCDLVAGEGRHRPTCPIWPGKQS